MAVQRRTSHRVESFKLPAGALEEALVPIEHTEDRCEHDEGVRCGKADDEECAEELEAHREPPVRAERREVEADVLRWR